MCYIIFSEHSFDDKNRWPFRLEKTSTGFVSFFPVWK